MGQSLQAAGDRYCASSAVVEDFSARYYSQAWTHRSPVLPDIGVHGSLRTYSDVDSDARLQRCLDRAVDSAYRRAGQDGTALMDVSGAGAALPGFVKDVGEKLAPFTAIPNTVGLGALVISVMLQVIMGGKAWDSEQGDIGSALQGVLNDEKSTAVRVTMKHYLKKHQIYLHNALQLEAEAKDTARELSRELSALQDAMMQAGQMRTPFLKQWLNGGAFHVLLMAHMANMNRSACAALCAKQKRVAAKATATKLVLPDDCVRDCSAQRRSDARGALDYYAGELPRVLERYQAYKVDTTEFAEWGNPGPDWESKRCSIRDLETGRRLVWKCAHIGCTANAARYRRAYVARVFAGPTVAEPRAYFAKLGSNLDGLMTRPGATLVPPSRLSRDLSRMGYERRPTTTTSTTPTTPTPRKAARARAPTLQPSWFCPLVLLLLPTFFYNTLEN